jgi:hypothetical protein
MRKHARVIAVAVAMVVPLFWLATTGAGATASVPPPVPSTGAYLGASAMLRSGETRETAIERTESQIGRTLAIDHQFYKWNQAIPTAQESADVAHGRVPFVSWTAKRTDGTAVPWASIASGAEDAWITARADAVKAFGQPMFLVFHAEPYDESLKGWGAPSDFVAAWRHIVSIFRARGVTNVAWVQVMTSWDYAVAGRMDQWYVGDTWTDWLAADPYNFFTRDGKWVSLKDVASPFYTWGSARAKPLMLGEWGSEEDPASPGRKGQWFDDARAWLKASPNIKAVVYFNNFADGYDWQIDTSSSSLAAFTGLANDPWFTVTPASAQAQVAPASTTTTTTAPATTTTTAPTSTTTAPTTTAPAPTSTTSDVLETWSATVRPSRSASSKVRSAAGTLAARYSGPSGATVKIELTDRKGNVIASATGSGSLAVSAGVPSSSYSVSVTNMASSSVAFTVTITLN